MSSEELDDPDAESSNATVQEQTNSKAVLSNSKTLEPIELVRSQNEENFKMYDKTCSQWITDRCDGKSKIGDEHPPCRLCYVPCLVKRFPSVLEQNKCCELTGEIGVVDDKKGRRWLMLFGLLTNLIGATLTTVSCFATSKNNYNFIRNTAFTVGDVRILTIPPGNAIKHPSHVNIDIGLAAVAYDNPRTVGKTVIEFQQLCNLEPGVVVAQNQSFVIYMPGHGQCISCAKVSVGLVSTTITSLLSYVPSIATDILRMYENYDVNCQKALGMGTAIFSFCMSRFTWFGYKNTCFNALFDGFITVNEDVDPVDPDDDKAIVVEFGWSPGPGYICTIIAALLQVFNFLCHALLRTPSITRNHREQAEYETL